MDINKDYFAIYENKYTCVYIALVKVVLERVLVFLLWYNCALSFSIAFQFRCKLHTIKMYTDFNSLISFLKISTIIRVIPGNLAFAVSFALMITALFSLGLVACIGTAASERF